MFPHSQTSCRVHEVGIIIILVVYVPKILQAHHRNSYLFLIIIITAPQKIGLLYIMMRFQKLPKN